MEDKDIVAKESPQKRNKQISFKVTEEERDFIKSIAGRTHYKNASAFCREMMLQICSRLEKENISESTNIRVGKPSWE